MRCRAIQARWVQRLIVTEEAKPWKQIAEYYLRNRAEEWGIGLNILLCNTQDKTTILCPPFWLSALHHWQSMDWSLELSTLPRQEKLDFPLWQNKWILHNLPAEEVKTLAKRGVVAVKDLMREGVMCSEQTLMAHFKYIPREPVFTRLINAIPKALTETVGSVETTGPTETWKRLRHRRKPVKGMRQQDFTTVTDGIPKGQVKWVGEAPMTNWVKVWSGI